MFIQIAKDGKQKKKRISWMNWLLPKVIYILSIYVGSYRMFLHRNIKEETDTEKEKTIYYYFQRFRDSSTEPDSK